MFLIVVLIICLMFSMFNALLEVLLERVLECVLERRGAGGGGRGRYCVRKVSRGAD